ncbi:MAG: MFS transporter [Planctomycetes bacterium]|nr:MFS transporter [Planctomycetota bacterium]
MQTKWRILWLLSIAELLAMTLWFSASAVVPQLTTEYALTPTEQSLLTMSVQFGFVIGALVIALLNLADRYQAHYLIAICTLLGALFNASIALFEVNIATILVLRFLTGAMLAGVYPPAMKVLASWFTAGRGLAIGILVGALSVGSAGPHLLNAFPVFGGETGQPPWRGVLLAVSLLAVVGGFMVLFLVRSGPNFPAASRFDWRYAGRLFSDPALRYANFGYLGHMWELYAMWTWAPLLLLDSFRNGGIGDSWGRLAGFLAVAMGGIGSVIAGRLADRRGRTLIASASLLISGVCCLLAGHLFDQPWLLLGLCLVWGCAVVADSAQFSTAISELCDPRYVGTALTMQTCTGFLLTTVSIWLLPLIQEHTSRGVAFSLLALGPAFGIWSMWMLRRRPEAVKMASGRK